MASSSTVRRAMDGWHSCARRTMSRSSCCKRERRSSLKNPGPACPIRACGSAKLEHLRGAGRLDGHLGARGDVLAGDHLIVALTGANHRIDARIAVDHHLQE